VSHTQVQWGRGNTAAVAAYTGPVGEVVVNTDDNSLHVQDGAAAGGHRVAPDDTAHVDPYSYQAPTTGFSITIANGVNLLILDPGGTLASGTVTMPASPLDGQQAQVASSQAITALTVAANTGQTIKGAPTTVAANGAFAFVYRAANTTWYRVQ
jgi:hypothetical protein